MLPAPVREGKAEVIVYRGIKFRRYPDSPKWADRMYYAPNGTHHAQGVGRLHVEIWRDTHGPVPPGHMVHHLGDTLDNSPDNLVCVPSDAHSRADEQRKTPEQRRARVQRMSVVREAARKWHGSPEGRAWHRELGKQAWEGRRPRAWRCEHCGNEFQSRTIGGVRFCSNRCKSAARRKSGVDNEPRACVYCGKIFVTDHYSRQQTCGRSCGVRYGKAKAKARLQPDS